MSLDYNSIQFFYNSVYNILDWFHLRMYTISIRTLWFTLVFTSQNLIWKDNVIKI